MEASDLQVVLGNVVGVPPATFRQQKGDFRGNK
jgi:hypothetical protein